MVDRKVLYFIMNRARRKLRAYYSYIAYHSKILPLPRYLRWYDRFRPENAKFAHYDFFPRKDEEVTLHAIWCVDLITPSQLPTAIKKMRRINWNESIGANKDPDDWMESTRNISAGGWRNLGGVAPIGKRYYGMVTTLRRFPKSFDYATFRVLTVTPSLTAIVGCFYLRPAHRSSYMNILRHHHFTESEPHTNGSFSILDPRLIKERNLQQERARLRREIATFMERNFGGFFSTNEPDQITTVETLELSDGVGHELKRFLYDSFETWEASYAGLTWSTARQAPPGHSVLCFRDETLDAIDLHGYGERDAGALLSKLAYSLPSNWTMEALHHLLHNYGTLIGRIRDADFQPTTSYRSRQKLFSAEKAREMSDIRLVASELSQKKQDWLSSNMMEFTRPSYASDTKLHLRKILPKNLRRRARKVLRHHTNVSAVRQSLNDSYAMFEMARIARRSMFAAFLSVAIAAFAVVLAFSRAT